MRAGNALTSSLVIGPMPLRPLTMPSQADATVLPTGETMPKPVTTTLRLDKLSPPGNTLRVEDGAVDRLPWRSGDEAQLRPGCDAR